jgi:protein-tyrosine kinase
MERIERALEIARLQRHRGAEPAVAPVAPAAVAPSAWSSEAAQDGGRLRLDDALLAELPPFAELRERCVIFPQEPGPAALAYKMLRTQVLHRAREHGMRCIGVVSAANGEGKTLTAINLALSLSSEPNQPVILLDLDLKQPSVANVLQLKSEQGLEAYFRGDAQLETIARRYADLERLCVIPTLSAVPGSSEVLVSHRAGELFKRLKGAVGDPLVIVDLPPVLLSDDVLAIAPQLDGVVLVVTEERTRREDVQRVFELLRSTPVIGTVLNGSADSESRAY